MRRVAARTLAGTLLLAALAACAGLHTGGASRVEDAAQRGDPQRRASMDLVLEGLDADRSGDAHRALSRYERALQIDGGNPYAHLALARYFVESGDVSRAFAHLDQAQTLFESADARAPGVEAHLLGLRGSALREVGRTAEGEALLRRAAQRAPSVWGDGRLDADEL